MYRKPFSKGMVILSVLVLGLMGTHWGTAAGAQEKEEAKPPERRVVMAAEYMGVEIAADAKDVSMDLIFINRGKETETLKVWVAEKPEGWKARLKTWRYAVTGVSVPPDERKTLTLEAEPAEGVEPGDYTLRIDAATADEKLTMSEKLLVRVTPKEEGKKTTKGVSLTTSFPVLRGPSDGKFEFSMDVDSKLDQESVFDLTAQGPEGWVVNFKPSYEDKFISSLRLKEFGNQSLALAVQPTPGAGAGEYPIQVRVSSGDAVAEAELTVILMGTYGLEIGTPRGIMELDARRGKPSNMSVYVKNTGTAPNRNVQFAYSAPENWQVSFTPARLDVVEPGDLKQVEVAVIPPETAWIGDYSVEVSVEGEKVSRTLDFRVGVRGSQRWGWIGIAAIVVGVFGLAGFFRWYGRR